MRSYRLTWSDRVYRGSRTVGTVRFSGDNLVHAVESPCWDCSAAVKGMGSSECSSSFQLSLLPVKKKTSLPGLILVPSGGLLSQTVRHTKTSSLA